MLTPRQPSPKALTAFRIFAFLGVAGLLTLNFFRSPLFLHGLDVARFSAVLDGTATRPYAGRVLVPWLARALSTPFRPLAATWMHDTAPGRQILAAAQQIEVPPDHLVDLLFVVVISVVAFYFSIELFFRFLTRMHPAPFETNLLLTLLAYCGVQLGFATGTHFFYDPFTLFAASLLTSLAAEKRLRAFLIAFAICSFNKETTLAYLPLAAAYAYSEGPRDVEQRRRLVRFSGMGVALYAAIRIVIALSGHLFREVSPKDNFVRDYLFRNFATFSESLFFTRYEYGSALLFVGLLLFRRLQAKPQFLRIGLAVSLIFVAGYLRGGRWGEVRVFYEMFPVFAALAAINLCELTSGAVESKAHGEAADGADRAWNRGALWAGNLLIVMLCWGCLASAVAFS